MGRKKNIDKVEQSTDQIIENTEVQEIKEEEKIIKSDEEEIIESLESENSEYEIINDEDFITNQNNDVKLISHNNNDDDVKSQYDKKPHKQQLIDDIIKISDKLNIKCDSRNKLTKKKIIELEKDLAKLVNITVKNNMNQVAIKKEIETGTSSIPDDLAVESLYNINFLMVHALEKSTSYLNLPVSLDGMTERMDKNKREELKKIFDQIIKKYGSEIKPYLSPIALYCYTMLSITQETILVNMEKKKMINSIM